jgi:tetratricopeptide (TPR) repeat protein
VPIDRAATLRNAEKLLRQGKLDAAIGEYLRVVEEQPRDWNTANMLGDLYVRARQVDKALMQFTRIADSLRDEGFLPKASALYKKVLKLKPEDEHALLEAADAAGKQGLYADARTYLQAVSERRKGSGNSRGVAEIQIRLGSLDPADYAARVRAAGARAEIGDSQTAVDELKTIATELAEKGRHADAIDALRQAAALDPADDRVRERLLGAYIAAGDFERARECASTVDQFKALAASLDAAGKETEALAALRDASRLAPEDHYLKAHLARAFVARGDMAAAAEYLTVETAGSDVHLLMKIAEIKLRGEHPEDGVPLLRRLLNEDPGRREDVAMLGWTIAEQAPETGYLAVELAADAGVGQGDWPSAAAALQEFVTRVPHHIPALMRLVGICVDGRLEATMYSAQAQLADAYIAAGSAAEALVIAEDLVAREPWERANVERFRRALVLMNEPDPDALIAERLSGQSPFTSTDFAMDAEMPPFVPDGAASAPPPAEAQPDSLHATAPAAAAGQDEHHRTAPDGAGSTTERGPGAEDAFELSADAFDVESILGQLESAPHAPPARSDSGEVDLGRVLADLDHGGHTPPAPAPGGDLDGVVERLRGDAARRVDAADEEYKVGLALLMAGDLEGAIESLKAASHAPKLRFASSSLLGRTFMILGMTPEAIEWFERAAEAPAPAPADSHRLLYELAGALESQGEVARALAICLELKAEAGDYKDVPARVDRLAKVQTRG